MKPARTNTNFIRGFLFIFALAVPLILPSILVAQSAENQKITPSLQKTTIVFLGDSITQAGNRSGGYVDLVRKAMKSKENVSIVGAGISGNKVPDLQKRLKKDVLDKNPTHVVIYIGINDVWHSLNGRGTKPSDFRNGLNELIGRIRKHGATPILCTPTVIGEKPLGENSLDAKLELYSQISRSVATKQNIPLIDLRKLMCGYLDSRPNQAQRKNNWLLTSDGVHMNAAGNRWLGDVFTKKLNEYLDDKKTGPLRHVVLFQFKESVSDEEVHKIVKAFGSLPSKIEEILDYEAGVNVSPEKLDKGYTHAFMVTFKNANDRDAYLPHPAHKEFVKILGGKLENVLVVDFQHEKK